MPETGFSLLKQALMISKIKQNISGYAKIMNMPLKDEHAMPSTHAHTTTQ